jgi:hypothetical protein
VTGFAAEAGILLHDTGMGRGVETLHELGVADLADGASCEVAARFPDGWSSDPAREPCGFAPTLLLERRLILTERLGPRRRHLRPLQAGESREEEDEAEARRGQKIAAADQNWTPRIAIISERLKGRAPSWD